MAGEKLNCENEGDEFEMSGSSKIVSVF